jgi:Fe2+ or Zn2+ uptake regulation protein
MSGYSIKEIVAVLKKHGIVVTPHRYKMLNYLKDDDIEDDYDDADWYRASRIYSSFLEEGYFISLSSVYKNLCLFRSMGFIDPDGRDL